MKTWTSIFSRSLSEEGVPRFYVKGTRSHLFGYDGYMETHKPLNQIFEFLGGYNKHNWDGSDSPMNVSYMQYIDYYDPYNQNLQDRLVVNAGNYFFSYNNPQGAYVHGFRLFRDLLDHFKIPQPRRLKGEGPRPKDLITLRIKKSTYEKLQLVDCVFFDVWPKGSDVSINLRKDVSLTEEELKKLRNEFDLFFGENCDDVPWRFIIGGTLIVEWDGDEPICNWIGGGRYSKKDRVSFKLIDEQ